jgi:hypothetical protein
LLVAREHRCLHCAIAETEIRAHASAYEPSYRAVAKHAWRRGKANLNHEEERTDMTLPIPKQDGQGHILNGCQHNVKFHSAAKREVLAANMGASEPEG